MLETPVQERQERAAGRRSSVTPTSSGSTTGAAGTGTFAATAGRFPRFRYRWRTRLIRAHRTRRPASCWQPRVRSSFAVTLADLLARRDTPALELARGRNLPDRGDRARRTCGARRVRSPVDRSDLVGGDRTRRDAARRPSRKRSHDGAKKIAAGSSSRPTAPSQPTSTRSRPASGSRRSTPSSRTTAPSARADLLVQRDRARAAPARAPIASLNTPYVNTIPPEREAQLPGRSGARAPAALDRALERDGDGRARQQGVLRARRPHRHLPVARRRSTRSASTTSGTRPANEHGGDLVYFQGHSSPGIYARAFLEGRLSEEQLDDFRQEVSRRRAVVLPAPVADARLLAVPDRVARASARSPRSTRRAS